MLTAHSDLSRRDFLRAGSAGACLSLAGLQAANHSQRDVQCILLFLVGGPSHLDTWDLKPDAPSNVRGPFQPIATRVPGLRIGEHFPRMAELAHHFALIRSVNHQAAPIHETGHQLMQTGHLFRQGQEHPHYGSVVSHLRGPRVPGVAPFVVLNGPIGNTGVSVSHGQGAGYLGSAHDPLFLDHDNSASFPAFDLRDESSALQARYGHNPFGQNCLRARRLIEAGVRVVTVNMFDTVFDAMSWDCHADGGALSVSLSDYKDTLCPMFDLAYTALLQDLHQRGMLANTLVLAMGEFGRTPQLNVRGGRDHWPGVWSVLFAGAGVRGGQVIGSSDRLGAEPRDRPVSPAEIAATVYQALGVDPQAKPIHELFA